MAEKRLALNTDGEMTYCSATDENVGKGRCNHIIHQHSGETNLEFTQRAAIAFDQNNSLEDKEYQEGVKYLENRNEHSLKTAEYLDLNNHGIFSLDTDKDVKISDIMKETYVIDEANGLPKGTFNAMKRIESNPYDFRYVRVISDYLKFNHQPNVQIDNFAKKFKIGPYEDKESIRKREMFKSNIQEMSLNELQELDMNYTQSTFGERSSINQNSKIIIGSIYQLAKKEYEKKNYQKLQLLYQELNFNIKEIVMKTPNYSSSDVSKLSIQAKEQIQKMLKVTQLS